MTPKELRHRARANFPRTDHAPLRVTLGMRRKWLRRIVEMGERWVLARPVRRRTPA